jgi:hypothetical protein
MSETKLTGPMLDALDAISRGVTCRVRFQTGEALRKRGLVSRSTELVIGRDYADADGVHEQWRSEVPYEFHEWYLTVEGRALAKASPLSRG